MVYEGLIEHLRKFNSIEEKKKELERLMNTHAKEGYAEYKKVKGIAEQANKYEGDPQKYNNALKVANEFNKKPKVSAAIQKRAEQCVMNIVPPAVENDTIIGEFTNNQGLNRETQAFLKMLEPKDAKFLFDNMNTADDVEIEVDNNKTTVKQAKQDIVNKAMRNIIQLSRESRNANTPEKEIELLEKFGLPAFIATVDLDGQKLENKILNNLKADVDPYILGEFNKERSHINIIDSIKADVFTYSNSLSTKINPAAAALYADICNTSIYSFPEEMRNEIAPIVTYNNSDESLEHGMIQFTGNVNSCFAPLLNHLTDGNNNKYQMPIEGLKQSLVPNLIDHGYDPNAKIANLKDLHFYNTKGQEINDLEEAFKKALDGEKIRIKDEKGKYLFTMKSALESGGKNFEDAKHNNIDLMESVFKAKDVKTAGAKETLEFVQANVNQEIINNLKDFEKTLEASNPGYVRNQKGKDQGPYSKALSEIKALTDPKAPKLSNKEMEEKLKNIRDLSENYLNSKMNKGKFNSLETKRFDAMDKIYQSLSGIEEKFEKVNTIEKELSKGLEVNREKANTKYPIDKDISEKTIVENKTTEKEKSLEKEIVNI